MAIETVLEGARLRPSAELLTLIDGIVAEFMREPVKGSHQAISALSEAAERIRADQSRLTKLIEAARPLIARLDGHNGGIEVRGRSIIQELLALESALKSAVDAVFGEGR